MQGEKQVANNELHQLQDKQTMPEASNGTSVTAKLPSAQIMRDAAGKQAGVFLDIKTYQHLLRQAEDAFDARLISETLDNEKIPWEVAKSELKRLGKI